jgi:ribosomal protein S10
MQKRVERYETMSLAERRLAILLGLKAVDRQKLEKVCAKMDEIRKKITPKAKGFEGVAEIRKWRETR